VIVLNKQPQIAGMGWSSSLLGMGLAFPHCKKQHVVECYTGLKTSTDSLE